MNRRRWLSSTAFAAAALAAARDCGWAEERPAARGYIKLDQNENPYGISKAVEEAIIGAARESNRYPLRELGALRNLIAEREKVAADCVILGAGSTEIFGLAVMLYGADGKEILCADPTYSGLIGYAGQMGGRLVRAPVNERFEIDLEALAKRSGKDTSLVYICNPNNPTGTLADGATLRKFCEEQARERVVLVDEAYFELVDDARRSSLVELVRQGSKVIVARTFSKLFGLAGLRIGYGIGHPTLINAMRRVQPNFCAVNRVGIAAARAAYLDTEHIALSRKRNAEARQTLYAALRETGHRPILASQANFVAFEAKGGSDQLVGQLRSQYQIGVRTYQFLGKSWVRVSMGTESEMAALTAALKQIG